MDDKDRMQNLDFELPKTMVTFLLDKSGSMEAIKEDTMAAFNAYLDGMRQTPGIEFSLLQFDSNGVEKTCVNTPIANAPALTTKNYRPMAGTPLIDAAYGTIEAVAEALTKRDDKPKVVVCIQTDGYENASNQHTFAELAQLIKEKTTEGWQFNFMGAGIDAYGQGAKMGISANNTMSYDPTDKAKNLAAFSGRAMATSLYASGASEDMSIGDLEKAAAGDIYAEAKARKATEAPRPTIQPTTQRNVRGTKDYKPIVDKITL